MEMEENQINILHKSWVKRDTLAKRSEENDEEAEKLSTREDPQLYYSA